MKKFVWDTSAIINIKERDHRGYSPAYSFMKDLSGGMIPGPYLNIFPTLAVFEVEATVSRKHRDGDNILRDFYLLNENAVLYDVDQRLIEKSRDIMAKPGFDRLRGADLVFACIAFVEGASLITMDSHYQAIQEFVDVIDLKASLESAKYHNFFE